MFTVLVLALDFERDRYRQDSALNGAMMIDYCGGSLVFQFSLS